MKILALEEDVPGAAPGAFLPHLKAEALAVWELQQSGVIREIYFRADRNDSVIILECPDVRSAETYLQGLPLVQEGLIRFECISLKPYPGFARLFWREAPEP